MFAAERRQLIVALLDRNGAMSLRELARQVEGSEVTVRRDLRQLAADGLLDRRRGGATIAGGLAHEPTYSEKSRVAAAEKAAIAELAVDLIHDGDAIVIGAGTTTQALARRLVRFRGLTVVTNSLLVAAALARARDVEVMMTGGTLRGSIQALVGSDAERALGGMRTSLVFISGNGLTAERGLSTPSAAVASIDRALAAAGDAVVVLADHTKVGVTAMCQTVPPERITRLFTDSGADHGELEALAARGTVVSVAELAACSELEHQRADRDPG